jgi:hypothetical protein
MSLTRIVLFVNSELNQRSINISNTCGFCSEARLAQRAARRRLQVSIGLHPTSRHHDGYRTDFE